MWTVIHYVIGCTELSRCIDTCDWSKYYKYNARNDSSNCPHYRNSCVNCKCDWTLSMDGVCINYKLSSTHQIRHNTRMYSRKMRTVRCSGHLRGGGFLPRGMSAQGTYAQGCLPRRVSAQEGVCPGGCLPRRVSAQEACLGGYLPRGYPSMQ